MIVVIRFYRMNNEKIQDIFQEGLEKVESLLILITSKWQKVAQKSMRLSRRKKIDVRDMKFRYDSINGRTCIFLK